MPKDAAWMPNIGLIGTENMSAPIVARLIDASHVVSVYAKKHPGLEQVARAGASSSGSVSSLLKNSDVVLLCLPRSEAAAGVIEKDLNPILLKEKIIIDLGTTELAETRRLSKFLKLRNAHFLDAPVTGGPRDVEKGRASIFCGGKREVFDRCERILKAIAGLGRVTFCGPAGSGQIVKGVYDMAVGLSRAAILESIAFGMGQGMEREQLWAALEHTLPQNIDIERIMAVMAIKGGEAVSCNVRELPYFLKAAQEAGSQAPLAQALIEFLQDAPPSVIDHGYNVASFWNELKRRQDMQTRQR